MIKIFIQFKALLATSPCQSGKTAFEVALIQTIARATATSEHWTVIVATDNKQDSVTQLKHRITMACDKFECIDVVSNVAQAVKCDARIRLVFTLDNPSQIATTRRIVTAMACTRVLWLSDEADVMTKESVGSTTQMQPHNRYAKSHVAWIQLLESLLNRGILVRHVLVTATPEACVFGYFDKNDKLNHMKVYELPIDHRYRGLGHVEWTVDRELDSQEAINGIVNDEGMSSLASNERRVMLISTEHLKKTHERQAESIIAHTCAHASIVYNGDGILVFVQTVYKQAFIAEVALRGLKMSFQTIAIEVKTDRICQVLSALQQAGAMFVTISGKHILSRGITLVADIRDDARPLAAASLIFVPKKGENQVRIMQLVGRIFGTAAPSYTRRVYTTPSTRTTLETYTRNLKSMLTKVATTDGMITRENINLIYYATAEHRLERPKTQVDSRVRSKAASDVEARYSQYRKLPGDNTQARVLYELSAKYTTQFTQRMLIHDLQHDPVFRIAERTNEPVPEALTNKVFRVDRIAPFIDRSGNVQDPIATRIARSAIELTRRGLWTVEARKYVRREPIQ